jgi:hypothetical protein
MSHPVPTALCFDVEDIVAPEEDDAVLWLADILHEHGLTGTFMVVGERWRQWERRGRQDVIEALKRHHVGYHSTWHSVHPTTTEICLDKDFAGGMDALQAWDGQGWADAERILGRPILGWGRTGNSWSPSLMGLMGRMGRAYIYSPVELPRHGVCWYAGCLAFGDIAIGGFDPTYCDDALFGEKLTDSRGEIEQFFAGDRCQAGWLCVFLGHPTRVIHDGFWDAVNFTRGANPPREAWKPAPRHPDSLVPVMQRNYSRLCEYLRNEPRLEIAGWGDFIQRYDGQRPFATHEQLLALARQVVNSRRVIFSDFFTAGEMLLMMCRALAQPSERYARPTVYGPLTTPPVSKSTQFGCEWVRRAAPAVLEAASSGYLPATVELACDQVGLGTFFGLAASTLIGDRIAIGSADAPYPEEAYAIGRQVERLIPEWIIHPNGMDLENLLEQTRLQCWALKPAWQREDLSRVSELSQARPTLRSTGWTG